MIHHHRILFHNLIMGAEEKMEEDRANGYLFPGKGLIEIMDVMEEQRIFTQPMQCAIVAIVRYRFIETEQDNLSEAPFFETPDGDLT